MYIYHVYINTQVYILKIFRPTCLHVYIYIYIIFIMYINIFNIQILYFSAIYTCMCVHLYIHNKYTQYTQILCTHTFILDAINRLTALIILLYFVKKSVIHFFLLNINSFYYSFTVCFFSLNYMKMRCFFSPRLIRCFPVISNFLHSFAVLCLS